MKIHTIFEVFTEYKDSTKKAEEQNLHTYNITKEHCKTRVEQRKERSLEEEEIQIIQICRESSAPEKRLQILWRCGPTAFPSEKNNFHLQDKPNWKNSHQYEPPPLKHTLPKCKTSTAEENLSYNISAKTDGKPASLQPMHKVIPSHIKPATTITTAASLEKQGAIAIGLRTKNTSEPFIVTGLTAKRPHIQRKISLLPGPTG